MNFCAKWPCAMNKTSGACYDVYCPLKPQQQAQIPAIPSPRYLPVNIPFSSFGNTVVTMDRDGNVTIKLEQPSSPSTEGGNG